MQGRPATSEAEEILKEIQEFLQIQQAAALSEPVADVFTSKQKLSESVNLNDFYDVPESSTKGRVVTVFLCGTCSNQNDHSNPRFFAGENVSHTFTITQGRNHIDKIIVDGPGSGEKDANALWIPYRPYSDASGQGLGSGINERIEHILTVLKNQPARALSPEDQLVSNELQKINKEQPIYRVNIVGWSRGAAAGITLANRMANDEQLKHIEVNMVLLDPVPGAGVAMVFKNKLPETVKNCYVIYAEDERSVFFNPVIPDCPAGCTYVPIIMPGGHAQVAGDDADHEGKTIEGANLRDVGIVSRYMMQHVLQHLGTKLDQNKMSKMTLKELLSHYKGIEQNRPYYKQAAQRVPYVKLNQLMGQTRKVIEGNSNLTNQYFSDVRARKFPAHDDGFLDYTHHRLDVVTKQATQFVNELAKVIDERLNRLEPLTASDMDQFLNRIKMYDELKDSPLLCRAISEELQSRYKTDDLLNLDHRCHLHVELIMYAGGLVRELAVLHARKLGIERMKSENGDSFKRLRSQADAQAEQSLMQLGSLEMLSRDMDTRKTDYIGTNQDFILQYTHNISRTKKILENAQLSEVKSELDAIANSVSQFNLQCDEFAITNRLNMDVISEQTSELNPQINLGETVAALAQFERRLADLEQKRRELNKIGSAIRQNLRSISPNITDISEQRETLNILIRRLASTRLKLEVKQESSEQSDNIANAMIVNLDQLVQQCDVLRSAINRNIETVDAALKERSCITSSANVAVERLEACKAEEEQRLQDLMLLEHGLSEQQRRFAETKTRLQRMAVSANGCTAYARAYYMDDIGRMSIELKNIKASIDRTVEHYNELNNISMIDPVDPDVAKSISDLNAAAIKQTIAVKTQLVNLLREEHNRICPDLGKWISSNDYDKTNEKLRAISEALSQLRSAQDFNEISNIAHGLLQSRAITRSRRHFDGLLNTFSIFGNGSSLKLRIENFIRQNKLTQPVDIGLADEYRANLL
jgi:hypothetical protein